MRHAFAVIVVLALACRPITAQTFVATAVPFLDIEPSIRANAMGLGSISQPSADPYAVITNPAHLGFLAGTTHVSATSYAPKSAWLPGFGLGLTFDAAVVEGGINLGEIVGAPVRVGGAYSRVTLDLGDFVFPASDPSVKTVGRAKETATAYSVGIGVDLGVEAALGMTFRTTESALPTFSASPDMVDTARVRSRDIGALIRLPISRWLAGDPTSISQPSGDFLFQCDLTIGAAITNIGGEVRYPHSFALSDPLPRSAAAGISIDAGISYALDRGEIPLLSISLLREARDLLVEGDTGGAYSYQGGFGNLRPWTNIISGVRSDPVDVMKGLEAGVLGIVYVRQGSFNGTGMRLYHTEGYGVRMSGLFRLAGLLVAPDVFGFLAHHLEVAYDWAELEPTDPFHPARGTTFAGWGMTLRL